MVYISLDLLMFLDKTLDEETCILIVCLFPLFLTLHYFGRKWQTDAPCDLWFPRGDQSKSNMWSPHLGRSQSLFSLIGYAVPYSCNRLVTNFLQIKLHFKKMFFIMLGEINTKRRKIILIKNVR